MYNDLVFSGLRILEFTTELIMDLIEYLIARYR